MYRRLGGHRPVWTGAEYLAPTGLRSLDRPARSESPYRLSYPSPYSQYIYLKKRTRSYTPCPLVFVVDDTVSRSRQGMLQNTALLRWRRFGN